MVLILYFLLFRTALAAAEREVSTHDRGVGGGGGGGGGGDGDNDDDNCFTVLTLPLMLPPQTRVIRF